MKILIKSLLLIITIGYCQADILSTVYFYNMSNQQFDYSLQMYSIPQKKTPDPKYSNKIYFGEYSEEYITNIPSIYPNESSSLGFYWNDQTQQIDAIGFNLMLPDGTKKGLRNLGFHQVHNCAFTSKDNNRTIMISYDGYNLIEYLPSGSCSFGVTNGYGPMPWGGSGLNVAADNKAPASSIIDSQEDARAAYQQLIKNNPELQEKLDKAYFEITGIDAKEIRAKEAQKLQNQSVKPW